MRKIICTILSVLILTLCGCSENKSTSVSETDLNSRLTATPDKLIDMYFEYLEDGDYDSISELYPDGFFEKEQFPYAEDYGLDFVPLTKLYDKFKGYKLESLDIFDYSFNLEMHYGSVTDGIHCHYNEWYGYNSDGFGKINCDVQLENYKKGDGGIYQFNFLFMRIDGVWYFIS